MATYFGPTFFIVLTVILMVLLITGIAIRQDHKDQADILITGSVVGMVALIPLAFYPWFKRGYIYEPGVVKTALKTVTQKLPEFGAPTKVN
ncbi:MAG: hypothetical protein EOP45_10685 [Sphingobacteriaceae bacterium]|nr:MAG: hypothetical protein EOP45_10685 [Sphingobacteriaceae bacterium]